MICIAICHQYLICLNLQYAEGWFWYDWECSSKYGSDGEDIHALCETADV